MHMEAILMVLLYLSTFLVQHDMLGEMWKNAANHDFSLREFNKTSLLFYNHYYRSKVMRLYTDYTLIADFSKENLLNCHLGSVDTSRFSLDTGAADFATASH
jgi:hypothetical protein